MVKKSFHEFVNSIRGRVKEVRVDDVMNMLGNGEDFDLIDVREESEYARSHIKGAKHIGRGILERDIHIHIDDHDRKIVLYCGGGYRSVLSADNLQQMGYTNVYSMAGGWREWIAKNGDTE